MADKLSLPPSKKPTISRATWDTSVFQCSLVGGSRSSAEGPMATPHRISRVTRGSRMRALTNSAIISSKSSAPMVRITT